MKIYQWTAMLVSLMIAGIAQADLVSLYQFDADVSPQPDASGNGHSAAIVNDAAWSDDRGGSMSFDGDGDYLEVADTDKLSITGDTTIAVWANFATYETWNAIVSKTGDAEKNKPAPYDLYTANGGSGALTMFIGNGSDSLAPINSTAAAPLNEWHHIAATISADGDITHYLNGELNGAGKVDVTREDLNTNLLIGGRADGALHTTGRLDDVAIFDQVLSQGEIQTIMTGDFTAYGVPEPTGCSVLIFAAVGLMLKRRRR